MAATFTDRRSPPELLREMLAEDRRLGLDFDEVFAEDVAFAARGARSWREALLGTRAGWRAAYDNMPGPGRHLAPELMNEFESILQPTRAPPIPAISGRG